MESLLPTNGDNFDSEQTPKYETNDDDANDEELRAWREVHSTLLVAVHKAQEAVAIQKAQRRYWLEEIVYNLDDAGRPTNRSVWQRPVPARTDTKETKTAKKTKGITKPPDTLTNTVTTTSQTKKKKAATKAESATKAKSKTDPDRNATVTAPTKSKKRRKKNDPDHNDDPTKPTKPIKRTKLVLKRTGQKNTTGSCTIKPKPSTTKTKVSKATAMASYDDHEDDSQSYHNNNDDASIDRTTSDFAESQHHLHHHHNAVSSISHTYPDTTNYNNNYYSTTGNYNYGHPNGTNDDPSPDSYVDVPPYNDHMNRNINDGNDDDDDENNNDDHDDDDVDDGTAPRPPPSSSSLRLSSHHSSTTTPTIRNYTSLQDIAMNDDDSDDEDRF